MKPEVVRRSSFRVIGIVTRFARGSESPELFGRIWHAFEARHAEFKGLSTDGCYYGVSFADAAANEMEYLAGMAVRDDAVPGEGTEARAVPAGEYAVFACETSAIGETYRYIFLKWLPGSGFEISPGAASFEQYPPEGKQEDPVRIHIPVRKPKDR